jgi:hypothetical protein
MKRSTLLLTVAILACSAERALAQHTHARERGTTQLGWLAGCWQQTTGNRIIEEQWMAPRGGLMLGQNRTVTNGKAEFELMRIFERADSVVFAATIPGQPIVEFASPGVVSHRITFSNPAHDFPQRVIYWREASDSLFARIEGTIAGQQRAVDFKFQRAVCEVGG